MYIPRSKEEAERFIRVKAERRKEMYIPEMDYKQNIHLPSRRCNTAYVSLLISVTAFVISIIFALA